VRPFAASALAVILIALIACNPPLVKQQRPTATALGTGLVVSVSEITAQTGDDPGTRAAAGFINGGIVGLVAVAGSDGGRAKLRQVALRLNDGSDLQVRSFSIAEPGQCVSVTELSGSTERILERLAPEVCASAANEAAAKAAP
jgi:hypothetical protein